MVEILVTLFVLSIGLLGVASLQFISAFANTEAFTRSQSVIVAQQLSERLRANASRSVTGEGLVANNAYYEKNNYNFANLSCAGGTDPYSCFCASVPPEVPNCQNFPCSDDQIAKFDAYEVSCATLSSNAAVELELQCADNDTSDADACSVGSRQIMTLTWPVVNWQGNSRVLNPDCNRERSTPHDCITVEITL